jgi:hypothetical protein
MIARSIVRSALEDGGYSECPVLNPRHSTLRWVKIDAGGRAHAICPTRWQDEWF